MVKIRNEKIFAVIFAAWIVIWFNYYLRDMTKGKYFKEYGVLLSRDEDGRKSRIYGDRLFGMLRLAERNLAEDVSYEMVGVDEASVDYRRAIYYLAPRTITDGQAQYVLVFNKPGYVRDGYTLYRELDDSNYVMKRK